MSRNLSFISIHPQFIEAYFRFGVFKAATRLNIQLHSINLRTHAVDKHGSIDDSPFGGGDGMVMRVEPLAAAVRALPKPGRVIYTSPSGRLWTQKDAERYAALDEDLTFICGRFAGIDQRFVDAFIDDEVSIGDFVVSGGELPSLLIADSILRQVPGVLGNERSAPDDSFGSGMQGMLEYPLYTRPLEYEGHKVPDVLLSGDHQKIKVWREAAALEKTRKLRPDLLKNPSKN
ncbi:tRNA (guanosine(37)-N1)-methyltransferase TrmD [Oligoflexus tunisiensis]|uniref:tRNA (guanosine(37)-N1)-methyltransferase TrmD n=1 Tax=Oligoflexus tunisiensis TaxID=708132 RepID=UPI000B05AB78|nr:tRNA (guanosine(37)-N1)-methyltransferase TrmD [Oligoflexus tunisiensis]